LISVSVAPTAPPSASGVGEGVSARAESIGADWSGETDGLAVGAGEGGTANGEGGIWVAEGSSTESGPLTGSGMSPTNCRIIVKSNDKSYQRRVPTQHYSPQSCTPIRVVIGIAGTARPSSPRLSLPTSQGPLAAPTKSLWDERVLWAHATASSSRSSPVCPRLRSRPSTRPAPAP